MSLQQRLSPHYFKYDTICALGKKILNQKEKYKICFNKKTYMVCNECVTELVEKYNYTMCFDCNECFYDKNDLAKMLLKNGTTIYLCNMCDVIFRCMYCGEKSIYDIENGYGLHEKGLCYKSKKKFLGIF